jgi:hypothetical protein
VQRYPNNFDYRYRLAYLCASLGRWERALQVSRGLVADITQGKPYYDQQWLPLLHYRIAETHVLQGEPQAAAVLLQALPQPELDATLRPWVALRLGNVYDLQGNRQAAQTSYARVAGDAIAEKLAAYYLTVPFVPGRADLKPPEPVI